jgi:hypothetical protein
MIFLVQEGGPGLAVLRRSETRIMPSGASEERREGGVERLGRPAQRRSSKST